MEKEIKVTPSYWNGDGKYQDVHNVLWSRWVPQSGESALYYGEVVRGLGRLWYEWGNNGNCNATDRDAVDGVSDMYYEFLMKIDKNIPNVSDKVEAVRKVIANHGYTDENAIRIYNELTNACYEFLVEELSLNLNDIKLQAIMVEMKDKRGTADFYKRRAFETQIELDLLIESGEITPEERKKLKERIAYSEKTHKEYMEAVEFLRGDYFAEAREQKNYTPKEI